MMFFKLSSKNDYNFLILNHGVFCISGDWLSLLAMPVHKLLYRFHLLRGGVGGVLN